MGKILVVRDLLSLEPTPHRGPTSAEGLGLAALGCELLEPHGFDFETDFLPVLRMGFILCSQRFFSLIEERGRAGAGQSSQQAQLTAICCPAY